VRSKRGTGVLEGDVANEVDVTTLPLEPRNPAQPTGGPTYTHHSTYTFVLASCKRVNPEVAWLEEQGLISRFHTC
jgi:hypothetical protein